MAFAWDTIYYPSIQAYAAALWPFPKPAWVSGVTLHHTWKPTEADWRGERSMDALERYYRGTLKWLSGPHLFVAPDGLWAGTPLASRGTHAGICNTDHIGVEIVGNFDARPWGDGLREYIYQLSVLLLQWAGVDETRLHGHRECLPNKSCPGWTVNMANVRQDVGRRLFNRRFVVQVTSARVRVLPRTDRATLLSVPYGTSLPAHPVYGSAYQGDPRWVRVLLPTGRTGYIWGQLGRLEPL
jgi:hypothetical protein